MPDPIVALLPMKANSKRVRGKNFREFNGRPLFRWILDTLLSVEQIGFASANARIGKRPKMVEMGRTESVDIDDAESWQMAEAMSMYLLHKAT